MCLIHYIKKTTKIIPIYISEISGTDHSHLPTEKVLCEMQPCLNKSSFVYVRLGFLLTHFLCSCKAVTVTRLHCSSAAENWQENKTQFIVFQSSCVCLCMGPILLLHSIPFDILPWWIILGNDCPILCFQKGAHLQFVEAACYKMLNNACLAIILT